LIRHAGKAELIDDDISPDANTGLLHDGSLSYKKKSAASRPETIKEDSSCPMPFYAMDDDVHNRNTGQVATSKSYGSSAPSCDEQSILYPSLEETDGHASIGLKERSASGGDHLEPFNTPSSPPLEGAPLVHQHQHHLTREPSKTLLIEAWAVDESSTSEIDDRTVYIAEEMTGCYTSKAKAIAGLCTVIVVVLGITLYYVLKPSTSLIPENIETASTTPSTSPTSVFKGDWWFCSTSSECANGCCSRTFSDDGKLKCTPLTGGYSPDICVRGPENIETASTTPSTSPTSVFKGDWWFCSTSSECANGCCSRTFSDDGKLKCTPLTGGYHRDICVGGPPTPTTPLPTTPRPVN
jgi:hypothetical protein